MGLLGCVWLGLLVAQALADINPGQIGLEFFGNEHAYTEQIFDFPTIQFTLTFRVKGASGNMLSYGVNKPTGFIGTALSFQNIKELRVFIANTEWATGVNFADGDWHAIALTWSMQTGEAKLYKDGNFVSSKIVAKGTPMTVDGYLVMGQQQRCAIGCFVENQGFIGTIADVTLWDKVLTPQQVGYLSTDSPAGDESGLVSYWPLNDLDSLQGRDASRTARNPINLGGVSWAQEAGMGEGSVSVALRGYGAVIVTPQSDLPTGDMTIEFWIKTSSVDNTVILSYFTKDGYPLVIRNPGFLTIQHNKESLSVDTSVANGAWNHVAITWIRSTGRLRVYKNSVQTYPPAWMPEEAISNMPTLDMGGSLPARPSRVVLGHNLTCDTGSCLAPSPGFNGMLQDVRIWSVIRTREQIQLLKDHFVPTEPVPDGLALNLRFNEFTKKYQRSASDSSTKNNFGLLTLPLWKNSLIAPPLPTLEDLNGKVAEMQSQMNDLFNFIKDAIDPPTPDVTATPAGPVPPTDAAKCDRRYKYLCTVKTVPVATTTAAAKTTTTTTPQTTSKPTNVNVLVQRAMHRRAGALFEQLAPPMHSHARALLQVLPSEDVEQPAVVDVAQALPEPQTESATLLQEEASRAVVVPEKTEPATTDSKRVTSASVGAPAERRRHAWAVGTKSTPREAVAEQPNNNKHEVKQVPTNKVNKVAHVTRTLADSGAHASIENKQVVVANDKEDEDSLAGFLEEAQTEKRSELAFSVSPSPSPEVKEDGEVDDMGPEALLHRRQIALQQSKASAASKQPLVATINRPAPPRKIEQEEPKVIATKDEEESEDLSRLQAQFEQERADFDSFNADKASDFPQGWEFDDVQSVAVQQEAAPVAVPDKKEVQAMLEEDEGLRKEHQQQPPHHRHHAKQPEAHHHHRHHTKHEHSKVEPAKPQHQQTKKIDAGEDNHMALANARQEALKTASATTKPNKEAKSSVHVDNGGVGGKFEQLVMSGAESEWDEAIAAGVGNSDLATDDVDASTAGDGI